MDLAEPAFRGGTNLEHARSHNRRAVIDAVRRGGALSRARIARLTGLAPQTVSNIVDELLAAGILRADPRVRSGRGQPAIPLRIDPTGGYGIGVELSPALATGALVDLEGRVVARAARTLRRAEPEHALPVVEALLGELGARIPAGRDRLLGLGLAVPGPFPADGSPTTLRGWDVPPSTDTLSARFGTPVFLEHDAGAAAIGERHYGIARALDDFVYLYVSTGLGAGLFVDGRLYKGRMGNAGEVGHISVDPEGEPCSCGNRGCLERYLSIDSAHERVVPEVALPEVGEALERRLEAGDDATRNWIAAAGRALRRAVTTIENVFDPETIVIGGTMPSAVLRAAVEAADPLAPSVAARRDRTGPRLSLGGCGRDTAVLGAACLPMFERFTPSFDALLKRHGLSA